MDVDVPKVLHFDGLHGLETAVSVSIADAPFWT